MEIIKSVSEVLPLFYQRCDGTSSLQSLLSLAIPYTNTHMYILNQYIHIHIHIHIDIHTHACTHDVFTIVNINENVLHTYNICTHMYAHKHTHRAQTYTHVHPNNKYRHTHKILTYCLYILFSHSQETHSPSPL